MEKPREKLLNTGNPRDLLTEDLFTILLSHGTNKVNVYDLSYKIAKFIRSKNGTPISIEDLTQFEGIGEVKAMQILSALELGRRYYLQQEAKKLSNEDWDFSELKQSQRQYGVHFFHHYTAKFIPQIPARLIRKFTTPNSIVVDPFMGSGTTLVEAKLIGCHSYGMDTNPMAIKIAKAKTLIVNEKMVSEIDDFLKWLANVDKKGLIDIGDNSDVFLFDDSKIWFRADVALKIKSMINKTQEYSPDIRNFIEVGISTLLKGISNARMDSVIPSLPDTPIYTDRKHYYREVNNQTRDIPVFRRVLSQITRMKSAIIEFNNATNDALVCEPILGDARNLRKYIKKCDLVVTSPPYWSAQNYQRIHMLSMMLYKLNIENGHEIGRNEKSYLDDMKIVFSEIAGVLHGHFALVIGHDDKNYSHEKLKMVAEEVGFKYMDMAIRRISNQVSRAKQINNEYIYLFKV